MSDAEPRVELVLVRGSLTWDDMDAESILDLADELRTGVDRYLVFEMDESTVYVNRDHIVRLDVNEPDAD